jgi:hypothetical protein
MSLIYLAAYLSVLQGPGPAPPSHFPTLALSPVGYELDLAIDYERGTVGGDVRLTVRNVSATEVRDLPLVLHRLMRIEDVQGEDGGGLSFDQDVVRWRELDKRQVTAARISLRTPLGPGDEVSVHLRYGGYLTPYSEIGWLYVRDRVDRDFTIIRPDALAYPVVGYPSWEANRAAGPQSFAYLARITVPADRFVANGGRLLGLAPGPDGHVTFTYENIEPAWRMDFAVAEYGVLEGDIVTVYYLPGDSAGASGVMAAAERSLRRYTEWFGPLTGASRFSVIEIPDGWGSQADVTSILQTAAAFNDPSRYGEVYHETAHLWHVTGKAPSPRWEEGLATYLQLVMTEELDGRNMLADRIAGYETRYRQAARAGDAVARVPMARYGEEGITGHAYRVGALMFFALHRIVGDAAFGEIVGGYYRTHADGVGTSAGFAAFADGRTPADLQPFFAHWLFTTEWIDALSRGESVYDFVSSYGRAADPGRSR